eukprot:2621423-Rhodomonas_salina.2
MRNTRRKTRRRAEEEQEDKDEAEHRIRMIRMSMRRTLTRRASLVRRDVRTCSGRREEERVWGEASCWGVARHSWIIVLKRGRVRGASDTRLRSSCRVACARLSNGVLCSCHGGLVSLVPVNLLVMQWPPVPELPRALRHEPGCEGTT